VGEFEEAEHFKPEASSD